MTTLIKYEAARAALAEARSVDEVKEIRDKAEAMRVYCRIAEDTQLEADAADIRERAERQLGLLLLEAKAAGQISRGQPKKNSAPEEEYSRVRLEDAGISHKLSSRAQKKAGIAERAYEAMLARMREQIISGKRIADVLKVDAGPINGARSVMGSRQEPDDSLDYFPTPPWATRALIERVFPELDLHDDWRFRSAWEPACGEGHIAEVLREYFPRVFASDVFDYGAGKVCDFLGGQDFPFGVEKHGVDWIITNPPFGDKAEAFVIKALQIANKGVAMFLRLQWLETIGRYEEIFAPYPPAIIAQFSERVPLHKGRWEPGGSTATAYLWIVWLKLHCGKTEFFWIPPGCRDQLTKPDDIERFTAHPVKRRPTNAAGNPVIFDDKTGEIPDDFYDGTVVGVADGNPPDDGGPVSPGAVEDQPLAAPEDDGLTIPDFLRRKRPEPESNVAPLPVERPFE